LNNRRENLREIADSVEARDEAEEARMGVDRVFDPGLSEDEARSNAVDLLDRAPYRGFGRARYPPIRHEDVVKPRIAPDPSEFAVFFRQIRRIQRFAGRGAMFTLYDEGARQVILRDEEPGRVTTEPAIAAAIVADREARTCLSQDDPHDLHREVFEGVPPEAVEVVTSRRASGRHRALRQVLRRTARVDTRRGTARVYGTWYRETGCPEKFQTPKE
jgi:hypothetical protein